LDIQHFSDCTALSIPQMLLVCSGLMSQDEGTPRHVQEIITMSQIKLFLFGPPRIEQNGQSLALGVRKGMALLVYLAVTRQAYSRDALATLFWPESNQQEARASLRRMLYRINQTLEMEILLAARDTVAVNPRVDLWLDVADFSQKVDDCLVDRAMLTEEKYLRQVEGAINLYTDDFMAGFTLPDCADFDDWQFFQREELRQFYAGTLEQLMGFYEEQAQYEQAIFYARRWLSLDRMHEPVHRNLMRLYAYAGQHSAALRQYEECARILHEELGVEPDEETSELFEAIRTRRLVSDSKPATTLARLPVASQLTQPVATVAPVSQEPEERYSLPVEPQPLVGRDIELAQLQNMLANPRCRLITLVGMGGMGKTHLALEVAHTLVGCQISAFSDGIVFVPLADRVDVTDPAGVIIFAMAEVLGLPLSGQTKPAQQVLSFLYNKKMLIILDNLEHLLHHQQEQDYAAPVIDLLEKILERAAGVKLLVTSREPLQLQAEWRLDLEGLTYPPSEEHETADTLHSYSAVQLFVQLAQQVLPSYQLMPENTPYVRRLCRLVAGSPLALKLAAAWVRIFTCDRIVNDIEQNLDLLSTQMRDIPARQRSMRAVFDYTWQLLSPEEQQLLLAISLFRGGFTEAAVTEIAGATPHLLAGLIDRGLLQVVSNAQGIQYRLHDLIRRYAADHLAANQAYEQEIREKHTSYYMNFLHKLHRSLTGSEQPQALAVMRNNIENMHLMWERALAEGNLNALEKTVGSFWRYYWSRTPGQEGKQFISDAISHLERTHGLQEHPQYRAVLRILYGMRGEFHYFLGDYELARIDFFKALQLAQQMGLRKEEFDMLVSLGSIARWRGETEIAQKQLHEALAVYRELRQQTGIADVLHELAQLYFYTGEYTRARECASESLSISKELGRTDWIGWALDAMAWVAFCRGDYVDARSYYIESLSYFEKIEHQLGIALALGGLGMVIWASDREKYAEAQSYLERSLAIARHISHQFHVSSRLNVLAQISNDAEQYASAQQYAEEGLAVARKVGSSLFTANNLCCLAESLYYRGNLKESRAHVREALTLAYEIRQLPALTIALYCYATSLVIESELGESEEADLSHQQVQALTLLEQVSQHSACWAVYREKASRLLNELKLKWPAEIIKRAEICSQVHTFDEQVLAVLHEGLHPVIEVTSQVEGLTTL
jgi:DNA-binding SARP family transcriptional activator/predicted ATPase